MHNRINELRRLIRMLRVSMLEAEVIMRTQINRNEDCGFVAGDILKMRAVMVRLVQERRILGDDEPIIVNSSSIAKRTPKALPAALWSMRRQLVSNCISLAQP